MRQWCSPAHGVPKAIPNEADKRNFFTLDATCPLVTKVHREAAIHFKRGREIILIAMPATPKWWAHSASCRRVRWC